MPQKKKKIPRWRQNLIAVPKEIRCGSQRDLVRCLDLLDLLITTFDDDSPSVHAPPGSNELLHLLTAFIEISFLPIKDRAVTCLLPTHAVKNMCTWFAANYNAVLEVDGVEILEVVVEDGGDGGGGELTSVTRSLLEEEKCVFPTEGTTSDSFIFAAKGSLMRDDTPTTSTPPPPPPPTTTNLVRRAISKLMFLEVIGLQDFHTAADLLNAITEAVHAANEGKSLLLAATTTDKDVDVVEHFLEHSFGTLLTVNNLVEILETRETEFLIKLVGLQGSKSTKSSTAVQQAEAAFERFLNNLESGEIRSWYGCSKLYSILTAREQQLLALGGGGGGDEDSESTMKRVVAIIRRHCECAAESEIKDPLRTAWACFDMALMKIGPSTWQYTELDVLMSKGEESLLECSPWLPPLFKSVLNEGADLVRSMLKGARLKYPDDYAPRGALGMDVVSALEEAEVEQVFFGSSGELGFGGGGGGELGIGGGGGGELGIGGGGGGGGTTVQYCAGCGREGRDMSVCSAVSNILFCKYRLAEKRSANSMEINVEAFFFFFFFLRARVGLATAILPPFTNGGSTLCSDAGREANGYLSCKQEKLN